MLASGLTLIFSMMGVLNFARGFYMLGAYFMRFPSSSDSGRSSCCAATGWDIWRFGRALRPAAGACPLVVAELVFTLPGSLS